VKSIGEQLEEKRKRTMKIKAQLKLSLLQHPNGITWVDFESGKKFSDRYKILGEKWVTVVFENVDMGNDSGRGFPKGRLSNNIALKMSEEK
jgi:hypothetical protein